MEIKETLFTKSFSSDHEDPYAVSLNLMKKLSTSYMIYEKKNVYETDGPVKKSTIVFDAVEPLDAFSSVRINFSLIGENGILYVDVTGYFVLKVQDQGFFTEIFTEFYLKNLFPGMRKASEKHMKQFETEIKRL